MKSGKAAPYLAIICIIGLAACAFAGWQTTINEKSDIATRADRARIMLRTCFHGGVFNAEIAGCKAFKKEIEDAADGAGDR